MATAFTPTPSSIVLPNMRVSIGGTAMGLTKGGVVITPTFQKTFVSADQYGQSFVQSFNNGDRVRVKLGLIEFSYANLNRALGSTSTLRSTGGTAVGLGGLYAGAKVGTTTAVALLLHPLDEDDSSLIDDVNIWKAEVVSIDTLQYNTNGEPIALMVEYEGILDTSKTAGKMLIDFGLAAAT